MLISKSVKDNTKEGKPQTNIPHKQRHKCPQQNFSKLNPGVHAKHNRLRRSEAYPRSSRLAQYANFRIIHHSNRPKKSISVFL